MEQLRKSRAARRLNGGVRKICGCSRGRWSKCPHPWHFNFKPKGGPAYRFSLDTESDKPIRSKTEAEALSDNLRAAIRAGTFRRRADIQAAAVTSPTAAPDVQIVTLASFAETYFERRGKPATANDRSCLAQLKAFVAQKTGGGDPAVAKLGDVALQNVTTDALELFFDRLRAQGRAASTRNRLRAAHEGDVPLGG